jgi:hypothetical protein
LTRFGTDTTNVVVARAACSATESSRAPTASRSPRASRSRAPRRSRTQAARPSAPDG